MVKLHLVWEAEGWKILWSQICKWITNFTWLQLYIWSTHQIYIYIYIHTYEVMISCVLDHTEHVSRMVQHMSLFEKSWSPAFSFIEKWLKRVGHAEERRKIGCSKYKVIRRVRNEEKERHTDKEMCSPKLREIHSKKERHSQFAT